MRVGSVVLVVSFLQEAWELVPRTVLLRIVGRVGFVASITPSLFGPHNLSQKMEQNPVPPGRCQCQLSHSCAGEVGRSRSIQGLHVTLTMRFKYAGFFPVLLTCYSCSRFVEQQPQDSDKSWFVGFRCMRAG